MPITSGKFGLIWGAKCHLYSPPFEINELAKMTYEGHLKLCNHAGIPENF